jgi:hypothetical protein
MGESAIVETVRAKFELLRPLINERIRRQWAACEALSLKRGGVTVVANATGMSRTTISIGMRELRERTNLSVEDENLRVGAGGADSPAWWRPSLSEGE